MIRGLYTAASGMINLLSANDNIANNMANISTPGFKQGVTLFKTFAPILMKKISDDGNGSSSNGGSLGSISTGASLQAIAVDFGQGDIKRTDNNYDLAIQGDAFFQVQTVDGKTAYTRAGNFQRDSEGYLTTKDGSKVIGSDDKPIMIGKNTTDFEVKPDGTILVDKQPLTTVDTNNPQSSAVTQKQAIGKIKLVEFNDRNALIRRGFSTFEDPGAAGPKVSTNSTVQQNCLEGSNANVITTMVKSIEGMRAYETLAKIVETTNGNLDKVVNQLGKIN